MSRQKTINFIHTGLVGDPYEAGYQQGRALARIPGFVRWFGKPGKTEGSSRAASQVLAWLDEYNPTAAQELRGTAAAWKRDAAQLAYHQQSWLIPAGCLQIGMPGNPETRGNSLGSKTGALLARSYELSDSMDDLRLCTTSLTGALNHIGFTCLVFGRLDGLNSSGLAVAMSASGMPVGVGPGMRSPEHEGLQFWTAIRAVLDRCDSVDEARLMLKEMPLGCRVNVMLADRSGVVLLVEIDGSKINFCEPRGDTPLLAANHFPRDTEELLVSQGQGPATNSIIRMERATEQTQGGMDVEGLKNFLSLPYPDGPCCHDYQGFFGTLHAMVFDTQNLQTHVSFGSTTNRQWHHFNLDPPKTPRHYKTRNPVQGVSPEFWIPWNPKV